MRVLFIVAASVCLVPQASGRPSELHVAHQFVAAVNARNVDELVRLTAARFHFRNQAWENASDGIGFVLGRATDMQASSLSARKSLLKRIAATVRVKVPDAAVLLGPSDDFRQDALKTAPSIWKRLTLYAFKRGEGDVEHVAVVGIDSKTGLVAAFYVN